MIDKPLAIGSNMNHKTKITYNDSRYRKGYSIGVGGVVLCNNKVLLIQKAIGNDKNDWAIPGGFVEKEETIDAAIRREILEETGVEATLNGLIAVRSRVINNENSAYFIFLLTAVSENAKADGFEVNDARYLTLGTRIK